MMSGAVSAEEKVISNKYGSWDTAGTRVKSIDYNSDGLDDLMLGPDRYGRWFFLQNSGTGFYDVGARITNKYGAWETAGDRVRVMDYDSDGSDDIVLGPDAHGKWYALRNNGGSFVDKGAIISGLYGTWERAANRIRTIDVNGDGRQDIVLGPDRSGNWYFLKNNGGTFSNMGSIIRGKYGSWETAGDRIRVIDYNADGLEDLMLGPDANGKWYGLRNDGGTFTDVGAVISGKYQEWQSAGSRIKVVDADGDGKQDLVLGPDSTGRWYLLRNTGGKFTDVGAVARGVLANWEKAGDRIRPIDFNGDGSGDLILGPDASGNWFGLDLDNLPPYDPECRQEVRDTIYEGWTTCWVNDYYPTLYQSKIYVPRTTYLGPHGGEAFVNGNYHSCFTYHPNTGYVYAPPIVGYTYDQVCW